ncbi:Uncharacterised protein [Serratia fonticola]|nr:Uncharacterised protein [Serratia fonticola]
MGILLTSPSCSIYPYTQSLARLVIIDSMVKLLTGTFGIPAAFCSRQKSSLMPASTGQ